MRQHVEKTAAARWVAAVFLCSVLLAGTGTGVVLARNGTAGSGAGGLSGTLLEGGPGHGQAPAGDPLRVRIPSIGVDAPLVPLGIAADGTLEVPRFEEAGWYAEGSRPGDPGPAVIAAHLDSTSGPAVFYRLEELEPGDLVHVDYGDGTVTFAARETASFPKSEFPTDRVYGWTAAPELRLVTCDGTFDREVRSYRDNLVVWAEVVTST